MYIELYSGSYMIYENVIKKTYHCKNYSIKFLRWKKHDDITKEMSGQHDSVLTLHTNKNFIYLYNVCLCPFIFKRFKNNKYIYIYKILLGRFVC